MKKLLFIFLLSPFIGFSQIDSNYMKVSLTLQARDWLYISDGINNLDQFERLYDSIKSRVHVLSNPNSQVTAKIDSINVGNLVAISNRLRTQQYGLSIVVFNRINTAIRGVSNTYLQARIDNMDNSYLDIYQNKLSGELDRIKKTRQ